MDSIPIIIQGLLTVSPWIFVPVTISTFLLIGVIFRLNSDVSLKSALLFYGIIGCLMTGFYYAAIYLLNIGYLSLRG